MKRLIPFVLGIVLIAGLVFINRNMNKGTEPDEDEVAQQQSQQPQKQQDPKPSTPTVSHTSSAFPDEVIGSPQKIKYKVLFGYTVDEASQANPRMLMSKINAVRVAVLGRPGVFTVMTDVDVPVEDRAPFARMVTQEGLTVNGVPTDPMKLSDFLNR